jgi:hypothetical protein
MDNSYEITLRQEVLTEYASSLIANYCRYMDENNISDDDKENDVVQKLNRVSAIMNDILIKYNTTELLDKVKTELKDLKNYIEE